MYAGRHRAKPQAQHKSEQICVCVCYRPQAASNRFSIRDNRNRQQKYHSSLIGEGLTDTNASPIYSVVQYSVRKELRSVAKATVNGY